MVISFRLFARLCLDFWAVLDFVAWRKLRVLEKVQIGGFDWDFGVERTFVAAQLVDAAAVYQ